MTDKNRQLLLPITGLNDEIPNKKFNGINTIQPDDKAFHEWYRFVLSFPPHLVRDYLSDFRLDENSVVLDPFCGTGTTLVESKLNHLKAVGLEANPFPKFASHVKTEWEINPKELDNLALRIAEEASQELMAQGVKDKTLQSSNNIKFKILNEEKMRVLIKNSISPLPLHKTIVLLDHINKHVQSPLHKYLVLALGNALVSDIGNLRFGPEVGVGKIKKDVPVIALWIREIKKMVEDLSSLSGEKFPKTDVYLADARKISNTIRNCLIDAVITSPPYPNEKDYTRTTRLESVVLGFYENMKDVRRHKKNLVRSNTRGVYKADTDDDLVEDNKRIQQLSKSIESRRIKLGKTSGFEKQYHRVTTLYFGGMKRHLLDLQKILKPGAKLAYVVGDQASYLQVLIQTGQILAEIAENVGFKVERIDLFRTRFATATQEELREEVVVMEWPGL